MKVAYVLYQAFIFAISLLVGSLILLLFSKALVVISMNHLYLPYATLINLIPVVVMATACLVAPSSVQVQRGFLVFWAERHDLSGKVRSDLKAVKN